MLCTLSLSPENMVWVLFAVRLVSCLRLSTTLCSINNSRYDMKTQKRITRYQSDMNSIPVKSKDIESWTLW